MKTLYLIRHAKSSRKHSSTIPDFERGLNSRGNDDCKKLTKLFGQYRLECIKTSTAKRTVVTAEAVAQGAELSDSRIEIFDSLYHASAVSIHKIIEATDDTIDYLGIVGHNPGMTRLVNEYGVPLENLPTSGVVCINRNVEQRSHIDPVLAVPQRIWTPKQGKKST